MSVLVGIDIGGTFTDLVLMDTETRMFRSGKSLTTYDDLSRGVFECLRKTGTSASDIETLVHGSTIAINIAIQRNGARTALVVTKGMRDTYIIGRGNRQNPYDMLFRRAEPYVPRHLIFEAEERHMASGEVLTALAPDHAAALAADIAEAGVDAVAVCFLHSYARPGHEALLGDVLRARLPDAFVSLSHEIVREYREYERTSTTVANAYIGPACEAYIAQLERGLAREGFGGGFLIMQSNGGVMTPAVAKRLPVAMMESGPVGGVIASAVIGDQMGINDLITFDMGGTTAKMSMIRESKPTISAGYNVGERGGGQPIMMPVVDIVEIGAGGGSVAWIDEVGALHVGPESAGSTPGPICYGFGGEKPTVTDANLLLGRLNAANFLGGEMALDLEAARTGMARELGSLGLSVDRLAAGIVRLAVANMVLAVRSISIERGYDPRDFTLVAQGGNGPLHALEVAHELGIPQVIVPPLPGVFSALGMLVADLRHDYVRTYYARLDARSLGDIRVILAELLADGRDALAEDGLADPQMQFEIFLDLRYLHQEFPLQIPVARERIEAGDAATIRAAFDAAHIARFGHGGADQIVEVVAVRLVATGRLSDRPVLRQATGGEAGDALVGHRPIWLADPDRPAHSAVYLRDRLAVGAVIEGPAVVEDRNSTTLLWPGDVATLADNGALIVKAGAA